MIGRAGLALVSGLDLLEFLSATVMWGSSAAEPSSSEGSAQLLEL